jgi:hypothetical protein
MIGGNAQDQQILGIADGAEAILHILDEILEVVETFVEHEVLGGAQAVEEAIAAGGIFAFGSAWAGGFLRVPAVGVELGLGGRTGFIRIIHVDTTTFRFQLTGSGGGYGWGFGASG